MAALCHIALVHRLAKTRIYKCILLHSILGIKEAGITAVCKVF